LETHSSLEIFGEEKEGAYLEEERDALHEGLSKTLERRGGACVSLELAWRGYPCSLSFPFLVRSIFMEEGRI
jgi:hypothetical protein